jgi:hypothetical protein
MLRSPGTFLRDLALRADRAHEPYRHDAPYSGRDHERLGPTSTRRGSPTASFVCTADSTMWPVTKAKRICAVSVSRISLIMITSGPGAGSRGEPANVFFAFVDMHPVDAGQLATTGSSTVTRFLVSS